MRDFNHVIISGVVHAAPELGQSQKGRIVKLIIKSKQDISPEQPHTEWYNVICPPPVSAHAGHLVAGQSIMIMGSLRSKDGGQSKSILAADVQKLA